MPVSTVVPNLYSSGKLFHLISRKSGPTLPLLRAGGGGESPPNVRSDLNFARENKAFYCHGGLI